MGNSFQGDGELMGRLIRHLILISGLWILLPAMALAQVIQNSATGDLNALSLDLSQATITLNRSLVDPGNSTVTVDPPIVTADGIAFSTITVTLRDGLNQPLVGRLVSLASSRGVIDTVTQPLTPTDVNGVTTGEIRSTMNGVDVNLRGSRTVTIDHRAVVDAVDSARCGVCSRINACRSTEEPAQ